ncbi:hypothetical protein KI387_017344, partial [Taxus chinensis]
VDSPTQRPPHPEIVPQVVKVTVEIDTLHVLQGLFVTLVQHTREISEPYAHGGTQSIFIGSTIMRQHFCLSCGSICLGPEEDDTFMRIDFGVPGARDEHDNVTMSDVLLRETFGLHSSASPSY